MRSLNDIALAELDRAAVELAARVLRESLPVERVVLFGSKAKGIDDPESDIDLLVLTQRVLDEHEEARLTDLLFAIEMDLEVVISPLVVPLAEWETGLYQAMPIRREIEEHGVAA